MYLTPADLLQSPGALELGQGAADKDASTIDATLMTLTIEAGDRSAYTADQIADADAALVRINRVIADVGELIDGYLAVARFALPLASVPGILRGWATDLFRYRLHDGLGEDSQIAARHKNAIKALEAVRDRKLSIGIADTAATSAGEVLTNAPGRVFTRAELSDY